MLESLQVWVLVVVVDTVVVDEAVGLAVGALGMDVGTALGATVVLVLVCVVVVLVARRKYVVNAVPVVVSAHDENM